MSNTALVTAAHNPDHYDLARIKQILKQHDPRYLKQGQQGNLSLSEKDINALLVTSFSLFNKQEHKARLRSQLKNNRLVIDLSFKLPDNQYGQYANVSLSFKKSPKNLLTIDTVNFGTLNIPNFLLKPLWNFANQYLYQFEEYQRLTNSVQIVQITPKQLTLTYQADWQAIRLITKRGQSLLVSDSERNTIQLYQQQLIQIINELHHKAMANNQHRRTISFSKILQPMFQFALKRSSKSHKPGLQTITKTTSAVEENKALLFVLAMHAAGKNIDSFIGSNSGRQKAEQRPRQQVRLKFTLRNRVDLMQHFSVSAFLASAAGDALAHAVGLFKEIADAKSGSGFSFADLAADRAGVEFGSMAVASELSAHSLQLQLSKITNEDDFMPDIGNLPEGLHEATFKRQYGSTEDTRYKKMQHELDRRISLCRIYSHDK